MSVRVLVGAQWGDEGKGKIVDVLVNDAAVVARFGGGPNAGHTVVIAGKKTVLHHIPSGALHPSCLCLLGNGVVIDAPIFADEIRRLEEGGVRTDGRIFVSPRAHLILRTHRLLDRLAEEARGDRAIGTTGKGIGPTYGDKVLRRGVRVGDLAEPDELAARVHEEVKEINRLVVGRYGHAPIEAADVLKEANAAREALRGRIAEVGEILRERIARGDHVLLEGAQGTLLDLDHGTYPFATSSSATSGGACLGVGIGPTSVNDVWGVAKAYVTRVGNGPFPTELHGPEGERLRETGAEYGSTTGRPRRCGWFDGVAARYATLVNGLDALAITKLDVLTGIDPLRVCVAYRIDGRETDKFPDVAARLARAEPVYETMKGWTRPIGHARRLEELPDEALRYLERLAELSACPIAMISVGAGREETIEGFAPLGATSSTVSRARTSS
jgi:adenylosuccinate synthase